MKIGEVIRKYRKELQMTQEEMANRLGVTTPAVNKWENGVSLPDITMLTPLARLLHISVDTLLSFREELTEEELREKMQRLWTALNHGELEQALAYAKDQIVEYPNAYGLMLWMAQALDAYFVVMPQHHTEAADAFVRTCLARALESAEESVRIGAADALFQKAVRNELYEEAEGYLQYFSVENPERKRKQALLYSKTNRLDEACRAYEELLYTGCQTARMVLQSLYTIAKEQGDMERAKLMAEKHTGLVRIYDMGTYAEAAVELEYALDVRDSDLTLVALKKVLDSVETIQVAAESLLYAHMQFNPTEVGYAEQLRCKLKQEIRGDRRFDFLCENAEFEEIIK